LGFHFELSYRLPALKTSRAGLDILPHRFLKIALDSPKGLIYHVFMSASTISTFQLFALFPDQEAARVYLESRLWPQGPTCSVCKSKG